VGVAVLLGTDEPRMAHTSALNAVFDSRWMVAGARLLALLLLVYTVASLGVRVSRGEWARSVGPVATDATGLIESQEDLQEQLDAARATIEDLRLRLKSSDDRYLDLVARMEPPDVGDEDHPEDGEPT
jgi:hypothetical protein